MNNWNELFITYYNINQYFDHIYYINLDKRKDRQQSISHQLQTHNISAERVSGVDTVDHHRHMINKGQLGCLLSHKYIIERAIAASQQKILILEDDTIFKSNFDFLFSRFVDNLPYDWDMLYLCGNHYGGTGRINDYVDKSFGTLSTNAYAINLPTMIRISSILNNNNTYDKPIDSIYCELHPKIRTLVSRPNLCYQMAGFSDIENKITDYGVLK